MFRLRCTGRATAAVRPARREGTAEVASRFVARRRPAGDAPAEGPREPAPRAQLGSWLEGPGGSRPDDQPWPGYRRGLPESGPGSVASQGRRAAQLVLDILLSALMGGLVNLWVSDPTPGQRNLAASAAFVLSVGVLTAVSGQSLGMRLLGLSAVRLADGGPPRPLGALVRAVLLLLLVPALVYDRDLRGLHDRAAGVIVLRT